MAGSHVRVTILKQRDHALRLVQVSKKRDDSVVEYEVKPYKLGTKFSPACSRSGSLLIRLERGKIY